MLPVEAYATLVALLMGSFINLAADRLPRGESVVRPRSRCRSCGRTLNLVDLVPVAGYLIRGGRCASCRAPIGAASPLVEATCVGLMLASLAGLGAWPGAAVGLVAVSGFGAVFVGLALARAGSIAESWRTGRRVVQQAQSSERIEGACTSSRSSQ